MKLCLPLGVSAVEFSATAGEQIRVAAILGEQQVDKYLTADLSKHPKRKDKWIAEAVKISSQASDPHIELEAVLAHCDGIANSRCDTRNVFDRLAVAEAGIADLNQQVEYWKKRYEETSNVTINFEMPAANHLIDAITESVVKVTDGQTESL